MLSLSFSPMVARPSQTSFSPMVARPSAQVCRVYSRTNAGRVTGAP